MLERVAHHYVGIKLGSERKYRILAEAQRKGQRIGFDVLYYAKSSGKRRSWPLRCSLQNRPMWQNPISFPA